MKATTMYEAMHCYGAGKSLRDKEGTVRWMAESGQMDGHWADDAKDLSQLGYPPFDIVEECPTGQHWLAEGESCSCVREQVDNEVSFRIELIGKRFEGGSAVVTGVAEELRLKQERPCDISARAQYGDWYGDWMLYGPGPKLQISFDLVRCRNVVVEEGKAFTAK